MQTQSRALAQTTVFNTATISSATTDPNTGNNSSTTSTQVFNQADLSVTKAGPASAISGNNITYTLSVTNNGPIFDSNVVLTETVPANTTFVSETQTSGPAFGASAPPAGGPGTITNSIASLSAGATAKFVIVVHVNSNAPNHSDIVNTEQASGSLFDPNTANNTATAHTTAITPTADLAITGSVTPRVLKTGGSGPIVHTLVVTNNGPDAASNVSLIETIPIGVGLAGETHPAGWSRTGPGLSNFGILTFSIASLAAGASATFTIVVKAPPLPAGTQLVDQAIVGSITFDPSFQNNGITFDMQVH